MNFIAHLEAAEIIVRHLRGLFRGRTLFVPMGDTEDAEEAKSKKAFERKTSNRGRSTTRNDKRVTNSHAAFIKIACPRLVFPPCLSVLRVHSLNSRYT